TVVGCQERDGAEPLAFGRRVLERPRELRERPTRRPASHVVRGEQHLHFLPEGARLAWTAVVRRRLAHEVEATRGARARCIEEVAVAADCVERRQPCAALLVEPMAQLVAEERR